MPPLIARLYPFGKMARGGESRVPETAQSTTTNTALSGSGLTRRLDELVERCHGAVLQDTRQCLHLVGRLAEMFRGRRSGRWLSSCAGSLTIKLCRKVCSSPRKEMGKRPFLPSCAASGYIDPWLDEASPAPSLMARCIALKSTCGGSFDTRAAWARAVASCLRRRGINQPGATCRCGRIHTFLAWQALHA